MPRLIVTDGTGAVTEHEISAGVLTVGRSSQCDIVVLEAEVSREHAVIEYDGEKLRVRDQDSHNGTWVNGERVEERELSDGDDIKVGETSLRVVVVDSPAPAAVARPPAESAAEPEEGEEKTTATPEEEPGARERAEAKVADREPVTKEEPTKDAASWQVAGEEGGEKKEKKKKARRKRTSRRRAVQSAGRRDRGRRSAPSAGRPERGRRSAPSAGRPDSGRQGVQETVDSPSPTAAARSGKRRRPDAAATGAPKESGPAGEADPTARAGRVNEAERSTRRKRELLGGMRLSQQQQLMVKIASFVVIIISLFGIGWMLRILTSRPYKRGRRIVRDPRAEPERLAEEACTLAREAQEAENRRDTKEAFRLICEAKQKIEEADRLYTVIAQKHEGEGFKYIQKMARKVKWRTKAIREQHFRLDMQLRREEGRL